MRCKSVNDSSSLRSGIAANAAIISGQLLLHLKGYAIDSEAGGKDPSLTIDYALLAIHPKHLGAWAIARSNSLVARTQTWVHRCRHRKAVRKIVLDADVCHFL